MIRGIIKYCLWFVGLIFLQIIIVNNLHINSYVFPYIYLFGIFVIPKRIPNVLLLIIGFTLGIIIDYYSNTSGIHAFATTLIAFIRNNFLDPLSPRDANDDFEPTVHTMGLQNHAVYIFSLTFIHHLLVFYLETFDLEFFFETFSRVIISSIITVLLIVILEYIFIKKAD